MDAVKTEGRKAAGTVDCALRRPLVPPEKNIAAPAGRRREVASRFKSGVPPAPQAAASSVRRCTSPSLSRASAVEGTASTNRTQSAERRRSSTPSSSSTPSGGGGGAASRPRTPVRVAAATEVHGIPRRAASTKPPDGLWASARSVPPLLQQESMAMATSAKKRHKLADGSSSDQTKVQARSPLSRLAKRLATHESRREDKTESGSDVSSQTSESSKAATRPSRTLSSPVLHRSSSPNKVLSAASPASTAFQSPLRTRPSAACRSRCCSTSQSGVAPPVFNYIVDARKGKKSASQIENIHQLRLLYNRCLQWQFVNAHSEDTLTFQKSSIESILYSVWKSIVQLRDSVTVRRIDVQLLQQELKLYYVLKEQIAYLQHWPELEGENGSTLIGAIEALQACTLRLPVTSGAQADAVAVKNSISSAVDVMQALSSSILYLLSKVEGRTSLVSELSDMARQEKVALGECRELLATAAKLQVQESSLRTHLMQLKE
uniref:AUGMIN subunit 8 n=1 Tax=Oryza meridionalis TaxID=40149 RepID=A0A0E0EM18_9ORYZ